MRYVAQYKGQIALYFLFVSLSIVFSIVSIGMLMPFLELIFYGEGSGTATMMKESGNPMVQAIRKFLLSNIQAGNSAGGFH